MKFFSDPRVRKRAASLLAAFSIAAVGFPSRAGNDNLDETLWKTQSVDAVVALKPCEGAGVCGYIYWVNPDDKRAYDYFGDRSALQGDEPTADDIRKLCGYSPKLNFAQAADGHWQGTMEVRGMGMTVSVDATAQDDNHMKVVTSKAFVHRTEIWTRIDRDDPKYPKCKPS